jgi:hypothetical protein
LRGLLQWDGDRRHRSQPVAAGWAGFEMHGRTGIEPDLSTDPQYTASAPPYAHGNRAAQVAEDRWRARFCCSTDVLDGDGDSDVGSSSGQRSLPGAATPAERARNRPSAEECIAMAETGQCHTMK